LSQRPGEKRGASFSTIPGNMKAEKPEMFHPAEVLIARDAPN